MAEGRVGMTPSLVREKAAEYGRQAEIVADVVQKMDKLLDELQADWVGDSSKGYAETYRQLKKDGFLPTIELIEKIRTFLLGAADEMEDADRRINSRS